MIKRLAERHPNAVARLALQYRMNDSICQLCNIVAYEGNLRSAPSVASRKLEIPRLSSNTLEGWLDNILDPNRPVVFANTDYHAPPVSGVETPPIVGLERKQGKSHKSMVVNDSELVLVRKTVQGLLSSGIAASSIGVISPLRAQVRLLAECPTISQWQDSGLEVSTIDRFQGRDKDVVLISFVRSNEQKKAGRLLNDFRRINVAVSRARRKLIMIGSFSTLHEGSQVLRPLLQHLTKKKGMIENVPQSALN